jgi:hypothetical protein
MEKELEQMLKLLRGIKPADNVESIGNIHTPLRDELHTMIKTAAKKNMDGVKVIFAKGERFVIQAENLEIDSQLIDYLYKEYNTVIRDVSTKKLVAYGGRTVLRELYRNGEIPTDDVLQEPGGPMIFVGDSKKIQVVHKVFENLAKI